MVLMIDRNACRCVAGILAVSRLNDFVYLVLSFPRSRSPATFSPLNLKDTFPHFFILVAVQKIRALTPRTPMSAKSLKIIP
jgi:hypothetical protein